MNLNETKLIVQFKFQISDFKTYKDDFWFAIDSSNLQC